MTQDAIAPSGCRISLPNAVVAFVWLLLQLALGRALVHAEAPKAPEASAGYLLVADVDTDQIHTYHLPDLTLTGTLDGVHLDGHGGSLALADGRVLFADGKASEIIALSIDDAGHPHITQRVAADLGEGAAWAAADRDFSHFVVVSSKPETRQVANVVDLATFENVAFEVRDVAEEGHPFLADDWLVLGVGGQVRAYPLDEVLAGQLPDPASILPLTGGSHGPVIAHDLKRGYISTTAGFDGFDFGSGELLPRETIIPWNVGERVGGQNYRPRLAWDGVFIYGAVSANTSDAPEAWADAVVDVHVSDLLNNSARRVPLATGIVSKFQLSRTHALFANVSGAGDFAYLFDVARGSPTYQQVVAQIPLTPLSDGPVVGEPTAGKQTRGSAITPDGRWGFVSHGGDGLISVIDVQAQKVTSELETPSALLGGGYLVAVQAGV
ncbi:MAG: hypothetical protein ABW321_19720, partial [Polyangiales bacterium]